MGCAGSTPMIPTMGSDMAKDMITTANHLADSAGQSVKEKTQEATEIVNNSSETVGKAVTTIAKDLETVYVDKVEMLEEAKKNMLNNVHMAVFQNTSEDCPETSHIEGSLLSVIEGSFAHQPNGDSSKIDTSELDIENAPVKCSQDKPTNVANQSTPNATLTELQNSKVEQSNELTTIIAVGNNPSGIAAAVDTKHQRPNTTEWEKYADLLAHTRKARPHELYRARANGKRYIRAAIPPLAAKISQPAMMPSYWPRQQQLARNTSHRELDGSRRHAFEDNNSSWSDMNYNSQSSPTGTHSNSSSGRGWRLPYSLPRMRAGKKSNPGDIRQAEETRKGTSMTQVSKLGRSYDRNPNRNRIRSPRTADSLALLSSNTLLPLAPLTDQRNSQSSIGFVRSTAESPTPLYYNHIFRNYANNMPNHGDTSPIRTRSLLQNRVRESRIFAVPVTPIPQRFTFDKRSLFQERESSVQSQRSSRSSTNASLVIVQSGQSTPANVSPALSTTVGNFTTTTTSILQRNSSVSRSGSLPNAASRKNKEGSQVASSRPIDRKINYDFSGSCLDKFTSSNVPHRTNEYKCSPTNRRSRSSDERFSVHAPYSIKNTYLNTMVSNNFNARDKKSYFASDLNLVAEPHILSNTFKFHDRCAVCRNNYMIK